MPKQMSFTMVSLFCPLNYAERSKQSQEVAQQKKICIRSLHPMQSLHPPCPPSDSHACPLGCPGASVSVNELEVLLQMSHNQNPVYSKVVYPEPCKEIRRRPQLFSGWDLLTFIYPGFDCGSNEHTIYWRVFLGRVQGTSTQIVQYKASP